MNPVFRKTSLVVLLSILLAISWVAPPFWASILSSIAVFFVVLYLNSALDFRDEFRDEKAARQSLETRLNAHIYEYEKTKKIVRDIVTELSDLQNTVLDLTGEE